MRRRLARRSDRSLHPPPPIQLPHATVRDSHHLPEPGPGFIEEPDAESLWDSHFLRPPSRSRQRSIPPQPHTGTFLPERRGVPRLERGTICSTEVDLAMSFEPSLVGQPEEEYRFAPSRCQRIDSSYIPGGVPGGSPSPAAIRAARSTTQVGTPAASPHRRRSSNSAMGRAAPRNRLHLIRTGP